jgi:hypothetical protein
LQDGTLPDVPRRLRQMTPATLESFRQHSHAYFTALERASVLVAHGYQQVSRRYRRVARLGFESFAHDGWCACFYCCSTERPGDILDLSPRDFAAFLRLSNESNFAERSST